MGGGVASPLELSESEALSVFLLIHKPPFARANPVTRPFRRSQASSAHCRSRTSSRPQLCALDQPPPRAVPVHATVRTPTACRPRVTQLGCSGIKKSLRACGSRSNEHAGIGEMLYILQNAFSIINISGFHWLTTPGASAWAHHDKKCFETLREAGGHSGSSVPRHLLWYRYTHVGRRRRMWSWLPEEQLQCIVQSELQRIEAVGTEEGELLLLVLPAHPAWSSAPRCRRQ